MCESKVEMLIDMLLHRGKRQTLHQRRLAGVIVLEATLVTESAAFLRAIERAHPLLALILFFSSCCHLSFHLHSHSRFRNSRRCLLRTSSSLLAAGLKMSRGHFRPERRLRCCHRHRRRRRGVVLRRCLSRWMGLSGRMRRGRAHCGCTGLSGRSYLRWTLLIVPTAPCCGLGRWRLRKRDMTCSRRSGSTAVAIAAGVAVLAVAVLREESAAQGNALQRRHRGRGWAVGGSTC